jgi:hypothetical protein
MLSLLTRLSRLPFAHGIPLSGVTTQLRSL